MLGLKGLLREPRGFRALQGRRSAGPITEARRLEKRPHFASPGDVDLGLRVEGLGFVGFVGFRV